MILRSVYDQVVLIDCKLESSSHMSVGLLYVESGQNRQVEVTDGTVTLLVTLPDEAVGTKSILTGVNRVLNYEQL